MSPANEKRRRTRLRDDLRDIASRPCTVTLSEIKKCWSQLGFFGLEPKDRRTKEGILFSAKGGIVFGVSDHHRGRSQVKAVYVRTFLEAMKTLGFSSENPEDEDNDTR
jgi:hypothetical protein